MESVLHFLSHSSGESASKLQNAEPNSALSSAVTQSKAHPSRMALQVLKRGGVYYA